MSEYPGEAEDAAFTERWQRWQRRYAQAGVVAPVPMWWPWPLERITVDDGDPDTGLIVIGLEPFLWPAETCAEAGRPYAKLVRQPAGEPPYAYGWTAFGWMTPEEFTAVQKEDGVWDDSPLDPVYAHTWEEGRWRWTVFICGVRGLTGAELARIRDRLDREHVLPQGVGTFRPGS